MQDRNRQEEFAASLDGLHGREFSGERCRVTAVDLQPTLSFEPSARAVEFEALDLEFRGARDEHGNPFPKQAGLGLEGGLGYFG